jgi:hypothetical protein
VVVGRARNAILKQITSDARFIVAPFDLRAAIELSLMTETAIATGHKKRGSKAPWTKVKFDRQIVAIARVYRVSRIYSDDKEVQAIGRHEGIPVDGVSDLIAPATLTGPFKLTPPDPSR